MKTLIDFKSGLLGTLFFSLAPQFLHLSQAQELTPQVGVPSRSQYSVEPQPAYPTSRQTSVGPSSRPASTHPLTPQRVRPSGAPELPSLPSRSIESPELPPLNPRKALFKIDGKMVGGETGNGGSSAEAGRAAEILYRTVHAVKDVCENHPELRLSIPCQEEAVLSVRLSLFAWISAERVYLCAQNRVVLGGLPETSAALAAYSPCLERDAVNFGQARNSQHRQVVLINRPRYELYLADLTRHGRDVLSNILHEALTLIGADQSDSYPSSMAWMDFITRHLVASELYSTPADPNLTSLKVESAFGLGFEEQVYASLATHRYVRATGESSLYRIRFMRETLNAQPLLDGSNDYAIVVTLERRSNASASSQTLVTRDFRFNSLKGKDYLPPAVRMQILDWLQSPAIPNGIL